MYTCVFLGVRVFWVCACVCNNPKVLLFEVINY